MAPTSVISAIHMFIKLVAKIACGTDNLSGKRTFLFDRAPAEQGMNLMGLIK